MRYWLAVVVLTVLPLFALAQEAPPPQPTPPDAPKESHRILFVVPANKVANAGVIKPLTPRQKLKLFVEDTYDPFEWAVAAGEAGVEQSGNEMNYGQGAAAYGKRFGAAMADESTSEFFAAFLLPTLLRQDPRYFRQGAGSFGHRLGYSLSRTVVTRSDSGKRQFNYSLVAGKLISAALSNTYYPQRDRGFGLTASRAAVGLSVNMASAVGQEFWPDVERRLFRRQRAERENQ